MTVQIEAKFNRIRKEERNNFEILIDELWDNGDITNKQVTAMKELINFGGINPKERWNIKKWIKGEGK